MGNEAGIVVYAVLRPDVDLLADDLREWSRGEMPKFMWPKHSPFVDDLPRTTTKKVQKIQTQGKNIGRVGRVIELKESPS